MDPKTTLNPLPALLLLGPTGSGKSPLGNEIERRGLGGFHCRHFDFGERLRGLASLEDSRVSFTSEELAVVRRAVERGLLLENEQFSIAEKLLGEFLCQNAFGGFERQLVAMNGLPRHTGQALDVARWVDIRWVVHLRCDAKTVFERIEGDTGGDRNARTDDRWKAVQGRVARFQGRTIPLLSFYREKGAKLFAVDVTASMTPSQAWEAVSRLWNAT